MINLQFTSDWPVRCEFKFIGEAFPGLSTCGKSRALRPYESLWRAVTVKGRWRRSPVRVSAAL